MTKFGIPGQNSSPLAYVDSRLSTVPAVQAPREPKTTDKKYPIWTEWRVSKNPTAPAQEGDFWKLIRFDSNGDAIWVKINEASTGPVITLSDTAGTKVESDSTGNIQLEGTNGISITSDANNNKLSFSLDGGSTAVDSVAVDATSGSGTDPVVPDSNGLISVTGGQLATGTIGSNVIRSISENPNEYTVQIQQSDAVAAKDTTKNGVAHFDSAIFSDDEGFISFANYATGSFTPGLTFGGGSTGIVYTSQGGSYTRFQNIVWINCLIELSNKGSDTGAAKLTGLPIAAAGSSLVAFITPENITYPAGVDVLFINFDNTATTATFYGTGSAATLTPLDDTHFANNTTLRVNGFYFV